MKQGRHNSGVMVAQDGSGHFKTISEAFHNVPSYSMERVILVLGFSRKRRYDLISFMSLLVPSKAFVEKYSISLATFHFVPSKASYSFEKLAKSNRINKPRQHLVFCRRLILQLHHPKNLLSSSQIP